MKIPPQSFSSLNQYQNCPHAYRLQRVDKVMAFVESEQMRWGNVVHKNLENALTINEPLLDSISWLNNTVDTLKTSEAVLHVEQEVAINADLSPSTFWDSTCWMRGKVDLAARYPHVTVQLDWKTGTRKVGQTEQLMLFAGFEFALNPACETVKTGYAWLKEKKIDVTVYERKQVPMIWGHFIPKMDRLAKSFETGEWPMKPSGLCGWCSATKLQCKHVKER
jgi:hypothetical protein